MENNFIKKILTKFNKTTNIVENTTPTLSYYSDNIKKYVNSTSLELFIILFLILYAGLMAHKLPDNVLLFLNNNYVKFLYLVLWLVVVKNKNWTISIIMIIIFLVTMKVLSIQRIDNKLNDLVNYMLYKNYIDTNNNNNNNNMNMNNNMKNNMKNNNNNNITNNNNNNNNMSMNMNDLSLCNNNELFNNDVDDVYATF